VKVAIGCDHGGYSLKQEIVALLKASEYDVIDVGCNDAQSVDYPDFAKKVCELVTKKSCDKGILICGTGIGMSMVANKVEGIRAALCHESFSARMSREHNDANVLCLGERVTGSALASDIVNVWLSTDFEGGRHLRRIQMFE
jgi:ribose 5-phosphate isomerase B